MSRVLCDFSRFFSIKKPYFKAKFNIFLGGVFQKIVVLLSKDGIVMQITFSFYFGIFLIDLLYKKWYNHNTIVLKCKYIAAACIYV